MCFTGGNLRNPIVESGLAFVIAVRYIVILGSPSLVLLGIIYSIQGCNPKSTTACANGHIPVKTEALNQNIVTHVCSKCVETELHNLCVKYENFDCFDSYVQFSLTSPTIIGQFDTTKRNSEIEPRLLLSDSCSFLASSDNPSNNSALNKVQKFKIGNSYPFYVTQRHPNYCEKLTQWEIGYFYAGVTLLPFGGFLMILYILIPKTVKRWWPTAVLPYGDFDDDGNLVVPLSIIDTRPTDIRQITRDNAEGEDEEM